LSDEDEVPLDILVDPAGFNFTRDDEKWLLYVGDIPFNSLSTDLLAGGSIQPCAKN
jgi:hypothetical protein